ncbi:hypothetical protein NEOLEDRAFT_1134225 [Neolentinus lepideus HHB14362 ss-1]|uniref:F-box domain-containing protein n=1 Tax=Neolentinus lepideus HHB14362 ss-1 TaxID=1314782 RepID=A0A165SDV1_9AGAM|nr:hypothetical protein NEOLEDRAFT_1134225 [Neolentinus lepideus HHB14362 ss-1]
MHKALTIAELQCTIIDHVLADDCAGTKTVAALARTCRTLHESAARALWRELPSLTPLLYCMPSDLFRKGTYLDFGRPLQPSDWTRVNKYAVHITTLHFQSTWKRHGRARFLTISPTAFATLARSISADCLLPNLRALTWDPPYGEDEPMFSFVEKLLARSLRSLTLRVLTASQVPAPHILRLLPSRCPSIRSFVIEYEGTNEDISDAIAECTSRLRHLRECEVYIPAPNVTLNHLASLPDLQSLTAWQCPTYPAYPRLLLHPISSTVPSTFAALQEISVRTEHITACTALACLIDSHEIKSITFTYSQWASASFLRECARALSHLRNPTSLTSLSIAFDKDANTPIDMPDAVVDDRVLRPLLVFTSLETFEFDPYCSFAIDDRLMEDAAVNWPRLRSLELVPKKALANTSRLTLDGLVPIVQNCPRLKTLCVPLEEHLSEPSLDAAQSLHNENITTLVAVSSTIEEPAAVILFLVHLFPRLQVIDHWAEDEDEGVPNPWEAIETIVRGINSAFPKETRGKEGRMTKGQLARLMRKWLRGFR